MEEIAISRFKATCLPVLERVRRTRKPILVTTFGKPVASLMQPPLPSRPESWLGSFRDSGKIKGDVISPVAHENAWEVLGS